MDQEDKPILSEVLPPFSENDSPMLSDLGSHYKELTLRDGAAIIADAASQIPGLGAVLKAALGLEQYSPEERLKERQFQWLVKQIPNMQKKLDVLIAQLPEEERPEPADVAATIHASIEASQKTADAKKRQLLKNALVNAFDIQQYRAGLTLRLFTILRDVEYGDVKLLRYIKNKKEKADVSALFRSFGGLVIHHIEVLEKLRLITLWGHQRGDNLDRNSGGYAVVSELGSRFLNFVAEPDSTETKAKH